MATARNQISTSTSIRKIALVIGIEQYAHGKNLPNAINDAKDVTAALKKIGFQVDEPQLNLTCNKMKHALIDFEDSLETGDLVLFYFAGHGTQWEDKNYLIPSDNVEISGNNLRKHAINAQDVLDRINLTKPLATIFILDCCRTYHLRNEDLDRRVRGSEKIPQGLREMSNEHESLIVFACSAGATADDQIKDRNGLFTKHLLQHIDSENEHVQMMLFDVISGVKQESKSQQIPYLYSSLSNKRLFLNATNVDKPTKIAKIPSQDINKPPPIVTKSVQASTSEFRPGKHERCEGRLCAKCGQCRDWYYTGNIKDWQWIQKVKTWTEEDWQRWLNGDYYKYFKERDGSTCHYRRVRGHHFYGHYYYLVGVCVCDDNGPK